MSYHFPVQNSLHVLFLLRGFWVYVAALSNALCTSVRAKDKWTRHETRSRPYLIFAGDVTRYGDRRDSVYAALLLATICLPRHRLESAPFSAASSCMPHGDVSPHLSSLAPVRPRGQDGMSPRQIGPAALAAAFVARKNRQSLDAFEDMGSDFARYARILPADGVTPAKLNQIKLNHVDTASRPLFSRPHTPTSRTHY